MEFQGGGTLEKMRGEENLNNMKFSKVWTQDWPYKFV